VTTDNPKKDYLNNEYVNHYIKLVKQRKDTNKYTPKQCNIQEFQNDWTLEYHLAQSCLKDDLLSAMKKAKEISDVGIDLPDDSSNAYEIMKPFLGNLSKALTAQCLANVLLEKGNTLKQDIENDTQLAYLVNAIRFAAI
jgi:putative ATP-dependent endonuclease of OLD family